MDIILDYKFDLSSKDLGTSFNLKFQTNEKKPPSSLLTGRSTLLKIFTLERELSFKVGKVQEGIYIKYQQHHAPVLSIIPFPRTEQIGFLVPGKGMFIS